MKMVVTSVRNPRLIRLLVLYVLLFLSFKVQANCRNGCHLALASYYVWQGSNVSYISTVFDQNIPEILRYNPDIPNEDSIRSDTRINIPFSCDCINGEFLGHTFAYITHPDDTYLRIARNAFANLTTEDWVHRVNTYVDTRIPDNATLNVTVNCSCGDRRVFKEYGLFVTYPLRPEDNLSSMAAEFGLPADLLQRYNLGTNFNSGTGIVYLPAKGNRSLPSSKEIAPRPSPLPDTKPDFAPRRNLAPIIAGPIVGGAFITFLLLILVLRIRRQRKSRKTEEDVEDDYIRQVPGMPVRFSYDDLRFATNDFKETLGRGGFGSVFKGVLADGTGIAVKRLDRLGQEKRAFLAEVETIGSVHHFNLVRLMGFCAEKSHRLLVYEYMKNGSLDNWIFTKDQRSRLDWKTRKKIILDVAKGLAYLHEECRQTIIHLDIKPQNILLDPNFDAKISDFGLSKLIDRDMVQVEVPMRGTPGYLAPEWCRSLGRITVKVDIYSFGIVLLEVVSGRKNIDRSQPESAFHLLGMLQQKAEQDRLMDIIGTLDDESMENHGEEAMRMIKIGAWCLQDDPEKRPLMSTVVKVLEGVMEVDSDITYKFSHSLMKPSPVINDETFSAPPPASVLSNPR